MCLIYFSLSKPHSNVQKQNPVFYISIHSQSVCQCPDKRETHLEDILVKWCGNHLSWINTLFLIFCWRPDKTLTRIKPSVCLWNVNFPFAHGTTKWDCYLCHNFLYRSRVNQNEKFYRTMEYSSKYAPVFGFPVSPTDWIRVTWISVTTLCLCTVESVSFSRYIVSHNSSANAADMRRKPTGECLVMKELFNCYVKRRSDRWWWRRIQLSREAAGLAAESEQITDSLSTAPWLKACIRYILQSG